MNSIFAKAFQGVNPEGEDEGTRRWREVPLMSKGQRSLFLRVPEKGGRIMVEVRDTSPGALGNGLLFCTRLEKGCELERMLVSFVHFDRSLVFRIVDREATLMSRSGCSEGRVRKGDHCKQLLSEGSRSGGPGSKRSLEDVGVFLLRFPSHPDPCRWGRPNRLSIQLLQNDDKMSWIQIFPEER